MPKKKANISKVLFLIHSPNTSPRSTYVFNYVFRERLGLDYEITEEESSDKTGLRISYSDTALPESIHIKPHGLLFKKTWCKNENIEPLLFPFEQIPNHASHDFPDIFSAIFYHLSRCEEYLAPADKHNRFDYRQSCLYRHDLLEKPIVDIWIHRFRNFLIAEHGLKLTDFKQDLYQNVPSIDIDSVFAYKGKNVFRQALAIGKDLLGLRFDEIGKRLSVLLGGRQDPNDNFDLQFQLLGDLKALYFIQVGPYGQYDKNVSPNNQAFRSLIKSLKNAGHRLGLHPSYGSNSNPRKIQSEKKKLEEIISENIFDSRQHFLRMQLPDTYRALMASGIKRDYSMGYSALPGFRAGTAFPFYWYDISIETTTSLQIFPFAVMDVTYKNYLNLSAEQTIQSSSNIKQICREIGAPFVFVFHNESLSGHRGWNGWDKVFTYWSHD